MAAAVPGAVLQPSDSIGDTVQLVIGPGYSTVVPVTVGAPGARAGRPRRGRRRADPGAGPGQLLNRRDQPKRPEM